MERAMAESQDALGGHGELVLRTHAQGWVRVEPLETILAGWQVATAPFDELRAKGAGRLQILLQGCILSAPGAIRSHSNLQRTSP